MKIKDIPRKYTQEAKQCNHFDIWKIEFKPKLIRKYSEEHYLLANRKKNSPREYCNSMQQEAPKFSCKNTQIHKRNTTIV